MHASILPNLKKKKYSGGSNFFAHFILNNSFTKPIPLAEVSLVQLPSVQVLAYSQATAQSFPHLKEKT